MRSTSQTKRKKSSRETQEIFGRLTALDPGRGRIEIEDERSPRRVWLDMKRARLRNLSDGDGDGRPSLTDLFPGDRVRVRAVLGSGGSMKAKVLWRLGPQGPAGGLSPLTTGMKAS